MDALTRFVLGHKRLVLGLWVAVTIAAFAAIGPAGTALTQEFPVPGQEGYETNRELGSIYGNGGDIAPLIPVQPASRHDGRLPRRRGGADCGDGQSEGCAARRARSVIRLDR